MKKYILTMFAMLVFATSFGQTFDGVKIGGTLAQMRFKLEQKGYKLDEVKNNAVWMNGTLANKKVLIGIVGTPKSKTVWKVVAYFDAKNDWYNLKNEFESINNILAKKYGETETCFRFFSTPYYEGDGYEISALANDKVSFACYYENKEEGKLTISIEMHSTACILLSYEHIQNSLLMKKEKEEAEMSSF
jgi:hypothetical protein